MITNPTFLQRLLKCSVGAQHDRHGRFDYERPSHQIALRLWSAWDCFLDQPRRIRFSLGNWLAFFAAKVRGEPYRDIGWGVQGNDAARLEQSLTIDIANRLSGPAADEILEDVQRLGTLARSNWWNPASMPKCCQPGLTAKD